MKNSLIMKEIDLTAQGHYEQSSTRVQDVNKAYCCKKEVNYIYQFDAPYCC